MVYSKNEERWSRFYSKNEERLTPKMRNGAYSKNEETEGSPLLKLVLFKLVQFREGSPRKGVRAACAVRCVRKTDSLKTFFR